MKVLFITNSYLGGHGGGVYASRTHINLFSELAEMMVLCFPYKDGEEPKGVNENRINLLPISDSRSDFRKFLDLLFGKVHRYSFDSSYFDNERFDVVVFDNSVVSSRLIKQFKRAGIKAITIHHNYQIEYLKGDGARLTLVPNLLWTWLYERQAVKNSNLNITLTQQDVELLQKHYDSHAVFAVLGVYEYEANNLPVLPDDVRGHRYVITGGLGSKQTEDSIIRWIKNYYPILIKEDGKASLTIAGSNPSEKLKQIIKSTGIHLVDSPDDMGPILTNADYYLCPVDCGGGLKLRNLDGLKYGLPVLTHRVSLRGYEKMENMGVLFSYDNTSDFTEGLKKIHAIKKQKKEIQMLYKRQYQYYAGVEKLRSMLLDKDIMKR